jgi:hypothetical protein
MSCAAGGTASTCQSSCVVRAPNASAWDTRGAGLNESATVVDRFVYALSEGILQRSLTAEVVTSVSCTADVTCKNTIVVGAGCTLSGVDLTQACVADVDFECARQQASANSSDAQTLIRSLVQEHMAEYTAYVPTATAEQATVTAQLLITLGVTVATVLSLKCSVTAEATNAFLCTGTTVADSKIDQCNYASVAMSCLQSSSEFTTAYAAASHAFVGSTPAPRVETSTTQRVWNRTSLVAAIATSVTFGVLLIVALTSLRTLRRPAFYVLLFGIALMSFAIPAYVYGVAPFRSAPMGISASDVDVASESSYSLWNHGALAIGGVLVGVFVGAGGGVLW